MHSYYNKGLYLFKHISITGLAQILVQAIGFISGILIIRVLSSQQYAFYTLANAFLGTMTVIANAGISTGVMAEGGKVWQNKEELGEVLSTGFELRKIFSLISLILGLPVLIYLLIKNDASYYTAILIALALIPAFFSILSNSLLEIAPKLHQDIVPLQKNIIGVNLMRLIFLCSIIFIFPLAHLAILSSSISKVIGNVRLRRIASRRVNLEKRPSKKVRKSILKKVKRILPDAIYYSLSGQITIWLLSIFGSTESVAEIGALARISILLSVIPILFSTLIAPRFSRSIADFRKLIRIYLGTQVVLLFGLSFIVLIVWFFSEEVLWILGESYSHLNYEIVLAISGGAIGVMSGVLYNLSSSRGWILHPVIYIGLNILTLIVVIVLFDVSTLRGVLWLNIVIGLVQLIALDFYGLYEIFNLKIKTK